MKIMKTGYYFVFFVLMALIFAFLMSYPAHSCELDPSITNYPHPIKCFKTITLDGGAIARDKSSMVVLLNADIRITDDCKLIVYYTRDGKPFDVADPAYECE